MSELKLSAEARRDLWQCYLLLLRLADEAEKNAAVDSELGESHESATATKANELARPDNDPLKIELEQTEAEQERQPETTPQAAS